jgi:hypothetical protein
MAFEPIYFGTMSDWSIQRVEQLAPDSSAAKAAHGTAKPSKWLNLGRTERLVWGECRGSGSNPYQVRADLIDVTYKCSCPSRKIPCKHTLALLLMVAGGEAIPNAEPPEFVAEWSTNRAKRAEAKQTRDAQSSTSAVDPTAKAKRLEKREQRISAGLDQLETWMADIVSQGLASARTQGGAFWSQMASRLVDAQAPGLARRINELGERAVTSPTWQSDLLAGLARLQLLIDAYRNIERLPADLAHEIRTIVGWTQEQDVLREREGVRDRWQVIARRQIDGETLKTQTTWLYGASNRRFALLLEFAVGTQPLAANYTVGQVIDAELVFYDGCPQLRALEKARHGSAARCLTLPDGLAIASMQAAYANALALNPWLERHPFALQSVQPIVNDGRFYFQDESKRRIPVDDSCRHQWNLVALARGGSLNAFGEWNGATFDPYSVQRESELFIITRYNELPLLSLVA